MAVAETGAPKEIDLNRELLMWRLLFAIFLAVVSFGLRAVSENQIPMTGLLLSLVALFLSLAVTQIGIWAGLSQRFLLGFQIGADTVCIAALVHLFGPYSAFPLLFCLPILFGAYYLGRRVAMIVASAAAVFTGGGQVGYALGWIFSGTPSQMDVALGQPVMVTMILILLFLLLGLVGGHMSERYAQRRRLQDQAAAQMQRARSEVRNILDNIQSGLLILDQNGVVTRTNPVSEKILGIPAQNMVGQLLASALGPEKAEFAGVIQKIIESKKPIARHELTITRGKEEIPIGVSVSHLEDKSGQIIGAIAIFQDLTDVTRMRKRIRESDRLAGVGELAASIAHEIRNPLGSIRGSVEILASELQLDGQHTQLLELILKESARVNTIINDFLSFARLRPASRQVVDCGEFLSEVALQIRQHVTVHGDRVRLSHRVDPPDLKVSIDPEQMVQLFLNLAINACEAMEYRGDLVIAAEQSPDGKWCEMKVQDSGPGIPEDSQSDLFKPFVTTKKTGTGLGLPMVARIANAHAGIVEVGESPTGGAVFCVKVPMPAKKKIVLPDDAGQFDESRTSVKTDKEPSLTG